jgi:hypothetical protein
VEKFGQEFSANDYSVPECMVLSSAAMVTASETVQRGWMRHGVSQVDSWEEQYVGREAGLEVMLGVIYTYSLP